MCIGKDTYYMKIILSRTKLVFLLFVFLALLSLFKTTKPTDVYAQRRVVGRIVNEDTGNYFQPESNYCGSEWITVSGAVGNGTLVVRNAAGEIPYWDCNPQPYYHRGSISSSEGPHTFTLTPPAGYNCSSHVLWTIGYPLGYTPPPGAVISGVGCTATVYLGSDLWDNHLWWWLDNTPEPPPPPTSVSCSIIGNTANLTWTAPPGNISDYPIRIQENGQGTNCDTNPYYICEPEPDNSFITGTSYSFSVTSGNNYSGWMHSRATNGLWSDAVGFTCTSQLPNCSNITGPTTITLGDTGLYTVEFECPGCTPNQLQGHLEYDNFNLISDETYPGTSGTMLTSWTPTTTGIYWLWCRAWNDAIAECRPPDLVDGPPRYPCSGPGYELTINVTESEPPPGCNSGENCCICIFEGEECLELADFCDEGFEAECTDTDNEFHCEGIHGCYCVEEEPSVDSQALPPANWAKGYFCDEDGNPTEEPLDDEDQPRPLYTATGCVPVNDKQAFTAFMLTWAVGIGGGLSLLLFVYAGFLFLSSQGNPQRLRLAKTILGAAMTGIIMLIFSVTLLKIIGVNILGII